MKRLTTLISALFLLTLGVSQVWALPDCPKDVSAYWNNCYGSAALNEYGDEYRGDWKDDKRHGQGSLNYIFGGKWNGKRLKPFIGGPSGIKDGVTGSYVGGWKDDKRHGHGSERASSYWWFGRGFSYVGEWKNGKKDGMGTITVNKMKVTCEWRNNRYRLRGVWQNYDRNMNLGRLIDLSVRMAKREFTQMQKFIEEKGLEIEYTIAKLKDQIKALDVVSGGNKTLKHEQIIKKFKLQIKELIIKQSVLNDQAMNREKFIRPRYSCYKK